VGLLLVAWPVWWLASLDAVEYGRTALAVTAVVAAAGAASIVVRTRHELGVWLHERRRVLLVEEAVFWLLFGGVLFVRWSNPDLWHPVLGGEKPMDLAFLNAVVKSPAFPPYDPWFAGGYINYYYFGLVLVAALVELTAIVPHVAYNLAVPTLAAFLGTAAAGAALALVSRAARPGARVLVTAVTAAVFVVVAGNLGEIEVVVDGLRDTIPIEWWYWNASRAIAAPAGEPGPITEFPAFTYLYADLHAHAMALPYAAVALVLVVGAVREPLRLRSWRGAAALGLLALVLGALWPTNTWDFPTYALLALVGLAAAALAGRRGGRLRMLARAAGTWLLVVGAAYLLYLPFHRAYHSSFEGVERWRGGRTSLVDYLTVHGFFLFLIVSALVLDLALARDLAGPARTARLALRRPRRALRLLRLHRLLVRGSGSYLLGAAAAGAGVLSAAALAVAGHGAPALIVATGTLAAVLLPRRRTATLWQLVLMLVLVGLAITLATEYVVVRAIDIGRTNTVFKLYLQVWLLWGLAAAVAAHRVYGRLPELRRPWRAAWRSAFVLLLAATLLYPALATPAKIRDRFDRSVGRTLDGTAFMEQARLADRDVVMPLADDLAAMRWMHEELPGSPVIAEVNTYPTLYGWGNRFAMFTGNPAIVGWDFHERQQRGIASGDAVPDRIADVQAIYGTADAERAYRLLVRHRVDYLVVGRLEHAYFPDGQAKWADGVGRLWEPVYGNRGVVVYRVLRPGGPGPLTGSPEASPRSTSRRGSDPS
jgi:YYY domain-containing protein